MQFIKPDINLDFVGRRRLAYAFSGLLILISIISLIIHGGPKYGIDFIGGTLIQVKFLASTQVADIKAGLAAVGLKASSVQRFGEKQDNEFLIRMESAEDLSADSSAKIEKSLESATGNKVEIRRVEMVGPQIGKDLREKALFAIFYSLLFITIYISGRFEMKWLVSGLLAAALIGAAYLLKLVGLSIPLVIVASLLVFLGGGIIHDFAFALMVGIIVGTYSSIYVASPILLQW